MRRIHWLICGVLPVALACNRAGNVEPTQAAASAAVAPNQGAAPAIAATPEANPPGAGPLSVGADVPDVAAEAQDGTTVRLRELRGRPVVVYFYPKDDTPGCTVEAKGIRDEYAELKSRAVVLGVSSDDVASHKAFASKYELPFLLLDDSTHAVAAAFGVPVSGGHAKRMTFVIDATGKVRKVFPNVNPEGHAAELIAALKELG